MVLGINTNVNSLTAQRNLQQSQGSLNVAMQRLTSGLRINSAKDDSAGLAISDRFTSQVRGLNQAVRNANDGISLAQTAEGAMQETTNILQRMRELAVQAANDTNSASDRGSIQAEINQLTSELDRIAGTTQFNGIKLLDGTAKDRTFQIGANAGETLSISVGAANSKALNLNSNSAQGELNSGRVTNVATTIAKDDVLINGKNFSAADLTLTAADDGTDDSAKLIADAINTNSAQHGVSAKAYNTLTSGVGANGKTTDLTINGNEIGDSGSLEELVANINRDAGGVTAVLNSDKTITLSNDTGEDIVIDNDAGDAVDGDLISGSGFKAGSYAGFVSLTSANGEDISITYNKDASGTLADVQTLGFNVSQGASKLVSHAVFADDTTPTQHYANGNDSTTDKILSTDEIKINGVQIGETASNSAADKAKAINAVSDKTGVTATARTEVTVELNTAGLNAGGNIYINGTAVDLTAGDLRPDEVVDAINDAGIQGIRASTDEDGKLVLTSESGLNIWLADDDGGADILGNATDQAGNSTAITDASANPPDGDPTGAADGETFYGQLTLESKDGSAIKMEGENVDRLGLSKQGGSGDVIGGGLDVSNLTNANNAIKRIDEAIAKVDHERSKMGAFQNRMEATISNLQNVSENLSAARSRIMDADFAAETANLTKGQILQQAGVAMLAQANQSQQNVLSLLR